ncbi:MAG: alanine--tRNA ligase [Deltaproteobacteria bacterium]|uniref:Alanine--tRNA ligase n=1 Tax=Candidatus Zymogenus saltonus TaxID=2844893 RepID=A0A9D8KEM5_9DELT|nr:alanine--tRNA ligase [Candidatus Zymogenus saltonus]
MKGSEIREKFLKYFEDNGHRRVRSSSLVPEADPTLLFTNAGMVQFKNVFTGDEKLDFVRAASSQKCLRVSGKHNDLENVGVTARHHTFFEMLGNFSFGDYFKDDAIFFGWDFLTVDMGLEKEKLWITIYKDDDEAFEIWKNKIGVTADRIVRMGEKDNFWAMGETGPCGPCSEIHIDQGEDMACGDKCGIGMCDCDRYLELWNLVFMQFNRDESGKMTPLPAPSIDTGMGLERIAAVVQGVKSNYDSDLFTPIISAVEEIAGAEYGEDAEKDISIRAISDHCRAQAFLVADGIIPANEGRGYVLRRIMRRAARHGKLLGISDPFMYRVADVVVDIMAEAYPELRENRIFIASVVRAEEEKFIETLDKGLKILNEEVDEIKAKGGKKKVLSGDVAFRLYDTYGFPLDLTEDIIKGESIEIDIGGFEEAMAKQRDKSKAAWKGSGDEKVAEVYMKLVSEGLGTSFKGYDEVSLKSKVISIIKDGKKVISVKSGEDGNDVGIVTERTPFYAEMGGQVGDTGTIETKSSLFEVVRTENPAGSLIVHMGIVKKGEVKVGDEAALKVNSNLREKTEANHSATHLLQAALRKVLGDHVKQSGSLVSPERLRFDYTHYGQVSKNELDRVEDIVNEEIRNNHEVIVKSLPYDKAIEAGAIALFGEKYGDEVRTINIPGVSMELCGGTHADTTGEIGTFKIVHEGSIASGIRRIEAVTGENAVRHIREEEAIIREITELLKTTPKDSPTRVEKLLSQVKTLTKEVERLKSGASTLSVSDLIESAVERDGIKVVARVIDDMDPKSLREFSDKVKDRLKKGIVVLGSNSGGKAILLVSVTKDITDKYKAGEIIKKMAEVVGGKGGGRPDMAQAGGPNGDRVEEAIQKVFDCV